MKFKLENVGKFKTRCGVFGCGNMAQKILTTSAGFKIPLCSECQKQICACIKQNEKKVSEAKNAEIN